MADKADQVRMVRDVTMMLDEMKDLGDRQADDALRLCSVPRKIEKCNMMPEHKTSGVAMVPKPTISAEATFTHCMAVQHFVAATNFSKIVKKIEKDNKDNSFGSFFSEIIWNYSACIILCVASIEAYLNEHMDMSKFDDEYAKLIDRQSIISRYNLYLKLNGKELLDTSCNPVQSIEGLIDLRNALVHFRPEWDRGNKKQKKLENRLPKLSYSKFTDPNDIFFPKKCITHSYTEWAVKNTYLFLKDFSTKSNSDFRLQKRKPDFMK